MRSLILIVGLWLAACASTDNSDPRAEASVANFAMPAPRRGAAEPSSPASTRARLAHDGMVALLGTLHAHSELSGDVGDGNGLSPAEAYQIALDAGLDFLGISDHHKPPGQHPFHLSDGAYEDELVAVAEAFTTSHEGDFVAIPGIEWGTISTGNHVNIFGAAELPPDSIKDPDYDELFEWAGDNAMFTQANHPYSWGNKSNRNKNVGNYGRALYSGDPAFVDAVDPAFHLMSIICTVFGGHISGQHADSTEKTHREVKSDAFREYKRHLNLGFHLSPAANQDTHGPNPGLVTAARTGVWVDDVSIDGIADGFTSNRAFATEDDELVIALQVEYGGEAYWMGDTVALAGEEDDVTIVLFVGQGVGVDGDAASEGPYLATVFSDADGAGGKQATEWDTWELDGEGVHQFDLPVVAGEYIFVEIVETNGSDNPKGDGEDSFNADGTHGADGVRDDLNDSAWTSPIWFVGGDTVARFVWSKDSNLYHDATCWAVRRIGDANRRESDDAPDSKTKHACSN